MTTATKPKVKSGYEVEQALVIRGDDPAATADEIAGLTKLSSFTFQRQEDESITDTYLNTANRDLKGSSLRVRQVNGKTLVTIKGKNLNAGLDKAASRSELEVEWPYEECSPFDLAGLFQLDVIQERNTNRRVLNAYAYKKNPKLVAEIAIDEVCYNFGDAPVRFYEVEVEGRADNKAVPYIVDALKKEYPELLKKWDNSKLSTGNLLKVALGIETDETGLVTDGSFDSLQTLFGLL